MASILANDFRLSSIGNIIAIIYYLYLQLTRLGTNEIENNEKILLFSDNIIT